MSSSLMIGPYIYPSWIYLLHLCIFMRDDMQGGGDQIRSDHTMTMFPLLSVMFSRMG